MRLFLFLSLLSPAFAAPSPARIRAELVKWEGYRLVPYRDGAHWSVGIGHNLTVNRQPARRYSPAEVERFFLADVSWALDACRKGISDFDDLPEQVQLVCISVAFGVGRTGFDRFRNFRLAMSYRAYDSAASELRLSKWATQVSPARRDHHIRVLRSF